MSDYKVSVVIPRKNRAELLFEYFTGLAEQSQERDQFEVVLVRCKRSVSGPAQAARRVTSSGCQFQGRSSAMRRAG